MVESVVKTFAPLDLATRYINSVPNIMANNSFLGTVAFISLDFDATRQQLHVESFHFLPAYTAAPPAVVAASVKHINLIPDTESLSAGMHILGTDNLGKLTSLDNCCFQRTWSSAGIYSSQHIPVSDCDISFNWSFQGSQNPQGSYNSARIETAIRQVRVTLFIRRPVSSSVTTGNILDFFPPQTFLFKLSSVTPGYRISNSEFHLYPSNIPLGLPFLPLYTPTYLKPNPPCCNTDCVEKICLSCSGSVSAPGLTSSTQMSLDNTLIELGLSLENNSASKLIATAAWAHVGRYYTIPSPSHHVKIRFNASIHRVVVQEQKNWQCGIV